MIVEPIPEIEQGRRMVWPELIRTWRRRALTLPLYFGLCALVVLSLPVLLPVTLVVDALRRRRGALTRALCFISAYLCCEVLGVLASALVWLASGVWLRIGQGRFLRWNFALENAWARALMGTAQRIYGMSIVIDEDVTPTRGPVLVLIRHVSVGDTLLPALLVSDRFGINLRYVLKRELLWDPCLDIVGNRLPNHFARRGSGDSGREVAAVQALMVGLHQGDGVLIYPEGTRFTATKREAILEKMRLGAPNDIYERAQQLRHLLPPRLGGVLGLLEHNHEADVLFVAHVGFEGTMDFFELLNGSLIGRVIRVGLWTVPFAAIPTGRAARVDWLFAQWQRMDNWIEMRSTTAA